MPPSTTGVVWKQRSVSFRWRYLEIARCVQTYDRCHGRASVLPSDTSPASHRIALAPPSRMRGTVHFSRPVSSIRDRRPSRRRAPPSQDPDGRSCRISTARSLLANASLVSASATSSQASLRSRVIAGERKVRSSVMLAPPKELRNRHQPLKVWVVRLRWLDRSTGGRGI